jgi:hypothetical protein
VDLNAIRSQFIQENLRRAMQERDREHSARAARALRNYFQWFEDRFQEPEKLAITSQLARLEDSCLGDSPDNGRPLPSPA